MTVDTLTPVVKGQLTKACKKLKKERANYSTVFWTLLVIFCRYMPRQQAKHQTRRYIQRLALASFQGV